jgi:hypothetical protein
MVFVSYEQETDIFSNPWQAISIFRHKPKKLLPKQAYNMQALT